MVKKKDMAAFPQDLPNRKTKSPWSPPDCTHHPYTKKSNMTSARRLFVLEFISSLSSCLLLGNNQGKAYPRMSSTIESSSRASPLSTRGKRTSCQEAVYLSCPNSQLQADALSTRKTLPGNNQHRNICSLNTNWQTQTHAHFPKGSSSFQRVLADTPSTATHAQSQVGILLVYS